MFLSLLIKELKSIFKSISFYGLMIAIGLFFFSQCPPPNKDSFKISTPEELKQLGIPESVSYGVKSIEDPQKEIRAVYMNLYRAYCEESIYKERLMINVKTKLNDKEKAYVKEAMDKIAEEDYIDNNDNKLIDVSYEQYLKIMEDLNKKLGGSTCFDPKEKDTWLNEPRTYEEQVKEFKEILEKDKLTNAAAREAADYMGITAGFFPIFLAAYILLKDKNSKYKKMERKDADSVRNISSYSYILSKYLALCIAVLIPYILISTYHTVIFYNIAKVNNYDIEVMAFYKYTIGWITPTILFTVAVGMFTSTILSSGIAAILIQFFLWIFSVMTLGGDYSLYRFVIRFNKFGMYSKYIEWSKAILINRIFYVFFSLIIVLLTGYIWTRKKSR